MAKVVRPDAAFVTLLRDPIDAFESYYAYMGLKRAFHGVDINGFAELLEVNFPQEKELKYLNLLMLRRTATNKP